MSRSNWRLLERSLRALGIALFIGASVGLTYFEVYFPDHRPHAPHPSSSETVPLPWTHPVSYGTVRDASVIRALFALVLCGTAIFAAGWAVRIYICGDDISLRGERARFGSLTRGAPPDESS